jgi:uncharacterized protein YjdB
MNTRKFFGYSVFAVIFVLAFTACDEPDGGGARSTLTINGLADYNGKYVFAFDDSDLDLFAAASVTGNETSGAVTGGLVRNGSVSLKVFNEDNTLYTGSDSNVMFDIISSDTATLSSDNIFLLGFTAILSGNYKEVTVSFNNGSATGTAVNPGSGGGGGGTAFSSLIGTWTKSTGQTLKAVDNSEPGYPDQNLSFWAPGSNTSSGNGDLYFRVNSYNGSTAVLHDIYWELDDLTITITATGTTLTISGFSGSRDDGLSLTQFNGTYTKAGGNNFVPVTNITGVPAAANVGSPLALTGTVSPSNATNKTIVWSVKDAGDTGASITGSTLTAAAEGTVVVTAAIANGTAQGTAYTKDFNISVSTSFVPVTSIGGIPTVASTLAASTPLHGVVSPGNATNKTIVWSIKNAGTTGAAISDGNVLTYTATGTVTVTATIANGAAQGTAYTQDFTITVSSSVVPVTNISGIPATASKFSPLTLEGTVSPENATNQTIVWSIKSAGTTGATINGNTVQFTAAGIVTVTATIANGTAQGTNYSKDFTITVSDVFVAVTNITNVPSRAYAGTPLTLHGTVLPADASYHNITWSLASSVFGVSITGNTLNASYAGNVTVTATIPDGSSGGDYTKDFDVVVYPAFVPVASISGVSDYGKAGVAYTLSGTVSPSDATNKTITWSVKDAGTTGAYITNNNSRLNFSDAGTAVITATINSGLTPSDGVTDGEPFTHDFTIEVDPAFVPVTNITGVPNTAYAGSPLRLSGTVIPANANNKTIYWRVQSGTGTMNWDPSLLTYFLNTTAAGTVVVTATITNGTAQGTDYTRTFSINVLASPPSINISIDNFNFTDEGEGVLTGGPPIVLSKAAKTTQTINATGLSDVVWYLGNNQLGTGISLTLNAGNFNVGTYTLSITFSKNGKSWIGRIPFAVTE